MAVKLWTSCLFCTAVLQAHVLEVVEYQIMFTILTVCSAFCYATDTTVIDIAAKHIAMVFMLTESLNGNMWLLIFPVSVVLIHTLEDRNPGTFLYATLHVLAVAGVHAYLYVLYSPAPI